MTPSEIITQEAQKVGYDADVMLRKINKFVQGNAAILLHKNDSFLLIITIANAVVEAHLFTVYVLFTLIRRKGVLCPKSMAWAVNSKC